MAEGSFSESAYTTEKIDCIASRWSCKNGVVPVRLIQIRSADGKRRVGRIEDHRVVLLDAPASIYDLAQQALQSGASLIDTIDGCTGSASLEYDAVYACESGWRILPAIDHPLEPARCLVSGTGLTHMGSAQKRQGMHVAAAEITDSMRMYQAGVEGGRPAVGEIGVAPEWFYKGNGTTLRGHGDLLEVPPHALDAAEEPKIPAVYLVD